MKYETAKDRERQKKASELFCHAFDLISIDRGDFASVDYDLKNKKGFTVGSLEVKGCPNRNIDDRLTVQVAIRKTCRFTETSKEKPTNLWQSVGHLKMALYMNELRTLRVILVLEVVSQEQEVTMILR